MLKWIVIACVAYLAVNYFESRFTLRSKTQNVDVSMQKLANELNQQMPMVVGSVRMDSVTYSGGVMHYEGTTLPGKELSDDEKASLQKRLKTIYCGSAFQKAGVGVDYTVKVSPTFRDTRPYPWVAAIQPSGC